MKSVWKVFFYFKNYNGVKILQKHMHEPTHHVGAGGVINMRSKCMLVYTESHEPRSTLYQSLDPPLWPPYRCWVFLWWVWTCTVRIWRSPACTFSCSSSLLLGAGGLWNEDSDFEKSFAKVLRLGLQSFTPLDVTTMRERRAAKGARPAAGCSSSVSLITTGMLWLFCQVIKTSFLTFSSWGGSSQALFLPPSPLVCHYCWIQDPVVIQPPSVSHTHSHTRSRSAPAAHSTLTVSMEVWPDWPERRTREIESTREGGGED